MEALLIGYNLMGFVDGTFVCPPLTISTGNQTMPNPVATTWICQDQLLLHAIFASVSEAMIPLIASCNSVMHLKDQFSTARRNSCFVSEFLQELANELAIIDTPISDDDLVIHALRGLGIEYKEIAAAIRARENTISFEEMHDKLVAYETQLKLEEIRLEAAPVTANYSNRSRGIGSNSRWPNNRSRHQNYSRSNQHRGPSHRSYSDRDNREPRPTC
ncbi:hypothetical protein EUGRSUZ_E02344 [Eucalyptus grandis]|uniref:Uncharacterized protein n=2 Tax=Eucalyptus grandis TaxID=71139 RepID=A0ACC3KYZ6_EUCGR|nr:hypothetical protein EUGRSUZ_E02344 [Eucalyptus grandis]